MSIRIYNTLSGKKEHFEPVQPGKVGMYVCGPTVYDSCHIGHARSVVVFDVIVSYLKSQDYQVKYVRNFTDVDDKIIKRANELKIDCKRLAEKYIDEFHEDMDALNVARPDVEPKATEHIDQIIEVIEKLIEKDLAYEIDGDVYFYVERLDGYGNLSGRKLDEMEAGARIDIDERKQNPFDFAVWKSAKPDEPFWKSPWGKGRPGWHIECSAMSYKHLGAHFDIHGGGKDLIFPHHENEIAQSEGAFGKGFAKYWVHNGFVNINHEKMSKSLGNFTMIKDVLKHYHPEAIRLFLLSNHYRSPIDFTDKSMEEATAGLDKIYALLQRIEESISEHVEGNSTTGTICWQHFCESMNDDFNTAKGIGGIFETVRNTNRFMDEISGDISLEIKEKILSVRTDILKAGAVLGILTESPDTFFNKKKSECLESKSIDPEEIEKMIQQRADARKAKDWAKADQVRDALDKMGIVIEDRPDETIWKVKD